MADFKVGDYVLSNYMLGLGLGDKESKVYGIGKLVKHKYPATVYDFGIHDFGIRSITGNKQAYKAILENHKSYDRIGQVFCCYNYNLRLLELTDPHFINAIVNQVFIEKEEEIKFKEYIRAKIQSDFKIPTLDSGYEPEKGLIASLADIISVKQGILTEREIHTTKPNVVWI